MRGVFVTGTDTGVGKTYFSCCLVRFLREKGCPVVGFKPIETGCSPECSDAEKLAAVSEVHLLPVYALKEPLAPSVASEIEGVRISHRFVVEKCREILQNHPTVIEGAGGIMVPITWEFTFLDLARELRLPLVVVALNKLGVINHTLLTVKACEEAGLEVRGIVLNSFSPLDGSFETNLYSLRKLLNIPVISFSSFSDIPAVVEECRLLEIFWQ